MLRSAMACGLLCLAAGSASADVYPDVQYKSYLTRAQSVEPVADFGEQVSLRDGSLSFRMSDIELRGNGPTIRLVRTAKIQDGTGSQLGSLNGVGDWMLEIPRIQTVVARPSASLHSAQVSAASPSGWQVPGTNEDARCTHFGTPGNVTYPGTTIEFRTDQWWFGYQLVDADGDSHPLGAPTGTLAAQQYTIGSIDNWVVDCLPQTANGQPGEAFLAIAPDGTKYWFNYLVYGGFDGLSLDFEVSTNQTLMYTLPREGAAMLVTRIEDRDGNWLTYSYSGTSLTGIDASDGRQLRIAGASGAVTMTTGTGTAARTWTYHLGAGGHLDDVTRPDGSKWVYGGSFGNDRWSNYEYTGCSQGYLAEPSGSRQVSVTAPSGATATFVAQKRHFGRSDVPKYCSAPPTMSNPDAGYALVPKLWIGYALTSKTVTGPGLPTSLVWNYAYSPHYASWHDECTSGCTTTVWTDVTNPAGERTRSTFSNKWDQTENKLLKEETFSTAGAVLRSVVYSYAATPGTGTNPYLWPQYPLGFVDFNGNDEVNRRWAPLSGRVITQDGATFTMAVSNFDAQARPATVARTSNTGGSRTEVTAWYDDTARWILGQVAQRTVNGLVAEKTDFDTASRPATTWAFGKLTGILSYWTCENVHNCGRLVTRTDGAGNTTWMGDYYRGIPRLIGYPGTPEVPAGATVSATVDDNGNVTSVTDENGYATSYGYDAMGRLAQVAYPTGDSTAWNATTFTLAPVTSDEFGIAAGHWRLTQATGNARKVTWYDGFMRPVLVREYDTGNAAGTDRYTATSYDRAGRAAYASYAMRNAPGMDRGYWTTGGDTLSGMMSPMTCYPMPDCYEPPGDPPPPAPTDSTLPGVHTKFDALARATSVVQDSELGPLTTSTVYGSTFKATVTNPRGNVSTTSYLAWDEPVTDYPKAITLPEGAYVDIVRDAFGKPTSIKRRNSGSTVIETRTYAYNASQELCRVVDPEVGPDGAYKGATLMGYDGAGNLAWSAIGLPATTACSTDGNTAAILARKAVRTYDGRNRVATLTFPDANGNQSWTYWPDGQVNQVTTYNDGGSNSVVNAYSYNKRRMLTGESQLADGTSRSIGYAYDANGSLSTLTYPDSLSVGYAPNALGQPTQAGTYATGVSYWPNGAIAQFTYGNGIVHTLTQNTRGLPERSRDANGSTSVHDDSYDYDGTGNVVAISDGVTGARGDRDMVYDGLDRLKDVTSPMYGTTGAHYAYDVLDNVTHITAPGRDQAYCYDASWRLITVAQTTCSGGSILGVGYDVQGNLHNWNGVIYTFDYGNRLRTIAGLESYRYDAWGRRVLATGAAGAIASLYGKDGQLLFQSDARAGKRRQYVYLGGSLVAEHDRPLVGSTVTVTYQHTDALGSPVATTNSAKSVLQRSEYEPYGKVLNRPLEDGPGFAGHVQDADTSLVYMQQRYYDPRTGRFWSTDPVTVDSAGANFNRYWYANDNPYRFTDPDGRQSASACDAACMRMRQASDHPEAISRESSSQLMVNTLMAADQGDFRTALSQGIKMIAASWREAFSSPGNGLLTIMSVFPAVGLEGGIAKGEIQGAATGFRGSRGFQLENASYQSVRNAPTVIGGRSYSGHALDQMQNRGLMPSVVENTIQTGSRFSSRPGTIGYFDQTNNVRVVTNSAGRVVTVIPGAP